MLEGVVTRKEKLNKSIKYYSGGKRYMVVPFDRMVDVEYLYRVVVNDNNTDASGNAYDCERLNAINAIIMLYGEKCLDSEFLTRMMNQILEGKAQIESAHIKYLEKTYIEKVGGRMGVAIHKSEPEILYAEGMQKS